MFHELYLEGVNLVESIGSLFYSKRIDLLSDMAEELFLSNTDVILKQSLHDLLSFLWQFSLFSALDSFYEVLIEVLVEHGLLVDKGRVPVVFDGVVTTSQEHICDICPSVSYCLVKHI